jgi:hypothetical protein
VLSWESLFKGRLYIPFGEGYIPLLNIQLYIPQTRVQPLPIAALLSDAEINLDACARQNWPIDNHCRIFIMIAMDIPESA